PLRLQAYPAVKAWESAVSTEPTNSGVASARAVSAACTSAPAGSAKETRSVLALSRATPNNSTVQFRQRFETETELGGGGAVSVSFFSFSISFLCLFSLSV